MKLLPIRCRLGDTRPIRAIAWTPTSAATQASINSSQHKIRDICPTHQFISDLKDTIPKSLNDILATMDEVAKNGPPLNDVKFSFLEDGLFEFKSWKARVVCFFEGDLIICTHGFYKKQQTTPKGEIAKAQRFRREYIESKEAGNIIYV